MLERWVGEAARRDGEVYERDAGRNVGRELGARVAREEVVR